MKKDLLSQDTYLNDGTEEHALTVIPPSEPIPDESWITNGELPELQALQRIGGYLFFRNSQEESGVAGGFRITSTGTPILVLHGNISHGILAHELVHFRHWLEIKDELERGGALPNLSPFEAWAILQSVEGLASTESRAVLRELQILDWDVRAENWDAMRNPTEWHPIAAVQRAVYPELQQLVAILRLQSRIRSFRTWFISSRSQRRELLSILAEREKATLVTIVTRAEEVRSNLVAGLNAAGLDRAAEHFQNRSLLSLIVDSPDSEEYRGYGQAICTLLEPQIRR